MVIQYFSLLFKRESGWNPERYRHCVRGGLDQRRKPAIGKLRRLILAKEAQVRRPA